MKVAAGMRVLRAVRLYLLGFGDAWFRNPRTEAATTEYAAGYTDGLRARLLMS